MVYSVNKTRYWVMADVHGMYSDLMKLMRLIRKEGFSFKNGDILVQLGDRCDRGPDTFRVNNYFYKLEKRYPGQIICLKGNHEDMMIKAATNVDTWGFLNNGGKATMDSYKIPPDNMYHRTTIFGYKLRDCGHLKWHDSQPHFFETDDYIFTHAPIPLKQYRKTEAAVNDFRDDKHCCFWSYESGELEKWVDPEVVPGKISVHGHIHGLYKVDGRYVSPGVRQVGHAFMIDTGAGCHPIAGYLTCLELPSMTLYNSKGEVLDPEIVYVENPGHNIVINKIEGLDDE